MAILKITDRSTAKVIDVKISDVDVERLKKYTYTIDQHHSKPFREKKIDGFARRIFLARDVMKFKLGDRRVVGYKNGDIHDCRRENLVEGRVSADTQKPNTGNFWPHTLKSLLNFLDKRKGEDEEVAASFFASALHVKYTRKRIDLILDEKDYDDYKSKEANVLIMRVLHKYFEWGGQIIAVKDLTGSYQDSMPKEPEDKKLRLVEKPKVEEDSNVDISIFEQNLNYHLIAHKDRVLDVLAQSINMQDLISLVLERGSTSKMALTVQFNSR